MFLKTSGANCPVSWCCEPGY